MGVETAGEERRRRRGQWPIRRFRLGEEPNDDLSRATTAEERLAMMWPLALDAFSFQTHRLEPAPRAQWPVRVRRLGQPEVD